MTKAIYIQREDGDWDFVAAFSDAQDIMEEQEARDWPNQIVEYLKAKGECVAVVTADLPLLSEILDGDSHLLPHNPSPIERQENQQGFNN